MGEILNLIESVSGGFPSYFFIIFGVTTLALHSTPNVINLELFIRFGIMYIICVSLTSLKDLQPVPFIPTPSFQNTYTRAVRENIFFLFRFHLVIEQNQIFISGVIAFGVECKRRKETPQKLTQLSSRSHPRHLVGKRTAQKDISRDTTSDSQVNSNFPNRWSPASLTFNNYFYLFLY